MKFSFLSATIIAGLGLASPAKADEPFEFLKVTCAQELHYFSVQRVLVYNLPESGPYRDRQWAVSAASSARIAKRHGLFDRAYLVRKPFMCSIPRSPPVEGSEPEGRPAISVAVRPASAPNASSRGRTSLGKLGVFEIIANGKSLGVIDIGDGKRASDLTAIEVKADGTGINVRTCRAKDFFGEGAIAPDETICTQADLAKVR
jgi:hypothetical protein